MAAAATPVFCWSAMRFPAIPETLLPRRRWHSLSARAAQSRRVEPRHAMAERMIRDEQQQQQHSAELAECVSPCDCGFGCVKHRAPASNRAMRESRCEDDDCTFESRASPTGRPHFDAFPFSGERPRARGERAARARTRERESIVNGAVGIGIRWVCRGVVSAAARKTPSSRARGLPLPCRDYSHCFGPTLLPLHRRRRRCYLLPALLLYYDGSLSLSREHTRAH